MNRISNVNRQQTSFGKVIIDSKNVAELGVDVAKEIAKAKLDNLVKNTDLYINNDCRFLTLNGTRCRCIGKYLINSIYNHNSLKKTEITADSLRKATKEILGGIARDQHRQLKPIHAEQILEKLNN